MIVLRPAQEEVLRYRRGRMGVIATPGSGKTWTLSLLAAQLVASGELNDDQEVLVVTLVNSAVENFYRQVSRFLEARFLIPTFGYRVCTLHSLANEIVRQRPSLVGLDEDYQIVDEHQASEILLEATRAWLREHPNALDDYLNPELSEKRAQQVRRSELPRLVGEVALAFMRLAKDQQLTPQRLRQRLDALPLPLPLAEMGYAIYDEYQRALAYRGALDFDDLIRLALQALESDPAYLERLRYRWPYILEDEAQDSSRLQEQILRLLCGPEGNWVRVGDPNQAIYETFTTANPQYLRNFLAEEGVKRCDLPVSGRASPSLIALANALVRWTQEAHPVPEVRNALQAPPWIEAAPPDDPQPNPPNGPDPIHIVPRKYSPADEIRAVAESLERWLPLHPDWTVAVLTARNEHGFKLVDELRRRGLPYEDGLLRSTSLTRQAARRLGDVLAYLAEAGSPHRLAQAYLAWHIGNDAASGEVLEGGDSQPSAEEVATLLGKVKRLEDYLWPRPSADWLESAQAAGLPSATVAQLEQFRRLVRRWQEACLLPIDQLVLTLAQDLLHTPAELALAHKLGGALRQAALAHPAWRLAELSQELEIIARNERRFLGLDSDDIGFDPQRYKGRVVVATMHRAKGLEWDRVYLMSVNDYDFPAALDEDLYFAEKWYLRPRLNLEAEALAQLRAALAVSEYEWYEEGRASLEARVDYARERLRLLYVGITRARRELVITWNCGRDGHRREALPLEALRQELERIRHGEPSSTA